MTIKQDIGICLAILLVITGIGLLIGWIGLDKITWGLFWVSLSVAAIAPASYKIATHPKGSLFRTIAITVTIAAFFLVAMLVGPWGFPEAFPILVLLVIRGCILETFDFI